MDLWIIFALLSAVCWGGAFAATTLAAKSRKMCGWGRATCMKWAVILGAAGFLQGAIGVNQDLPSGKVLLAFGGAEIVVVVAFFQFLRQWAVREIFRRAKIVERANNVQELKRLGKIRDGLQQGRLPVELLSPSEQTLIELTLEATGITIKRIRRP